MSTVSDIMDALVGCCLERAPLEAQPTTPLPAAAAPDQQAGEIALWAGSCGASLDRLVRIRLSAGPVETQMLWLFGVEDSAVPHYHAQLVSMPGGRFVHNVDLLPRVDLALHPDYTAEVFAPLTQPRAELVGNAEFACSRGGVPPSMAVFLSPWGVLGAGASLAEVEQARALFQRYLEHVLDLAQGMKSAPGAQELQARHAALVAAHTNEDLDKRAWGGTRRMVGDDGVQAIQRALRESRRLT